jgi:hypothetical protein
MHGDAVAGDYPFPCSMKTSLPDFHHGQRYEILTEVFFINLPGRFLLQQQVSPATPTMATSLSVRRSTDTRTIANTGGNVHEKKIE